MMAVTIAALTFMDFGSLIFASTPSECQNQIVTLKGAVNFVPMDTSSDAQVRSRLTQTLDDASSRIEQSRIKEAVGKVDNFKTNVKSLSNGKTPKLDPGNADYLISQADGVIRCINGISGGQ